MTPATLIISSVVGAVLTVIGHYLGSSKAAPASPPQPAPTPDPAPAPVVPTTFGHGELVRYALQLAGPVIHDAFAAAVQRGLANALTAPTAAPTAK